MSALPCEKAKVPSMDEIIRTISTNDKLSGLFLRIIAFIIYLDLTYIFQSVAKAMCICRKL